MDDLSDAGANEWRWIRWRPTDPAAPRRGGGYDRGTTFELVNSEHSHLNAYAMLFPQRVSREACSRATSQGPVYPWIYSFIEGAFTRTGSRQRMYRTEYVTCPSRAGTRFTQEIIIEEASKIVGRFEAPTFMYPKHQYDLQDDGVTEAIVEWHRRATPARREGVIGIISVKGSVYRELYRGKWEVSEDCPRKGALITQIALGVRPVGVRTLEILEEQWRVGCDPADIEAEIGEWKLTQAQTSTIDLTASP